MNIFKKTLIEVVVVVSVLVILVLIMNYFYADEEITRTIETRLVGQELILEVADTSYSQSIGLSGRENLGENEGMLFTYDYEVEGLTFWMKNTLIPLDILFLSKDGEILHIVENVPICEEDPCPTYTYEGSAQYVLELNAGWTEKHDAKEGDVLEVKVLDQSDS